MILLRNFVAVALVVPCLYMGYSAYSNYNGVCLAQHRRLSENELIAAAVETKLNGTIIHRISAFTTEPPHDEIYRDSIQPYRSAEEFFAENPHCCDVSQPPPGDDWQPASFYMKISGAARDFVNLKYVDRRVDELGAVTTEAMTDYILVGNCGKVTTQFN